ncbi:hypothetical protein Q8791_07605 [Nocardiopsis sp. CT-R113]|uniref:Secreted protein n=1 Tax=Nocardiopsis codii TaxID=3065942 RepID=A0ABU7K4A7_9ACTN|nr:hypothetical protein [Nocardiopsis sp. CT-R113]MEE2037084.1 hypothetical protein [Nocardiopsis sp. CT-R113]
MDVALLVLVVTGAVVAGVCALVFAGSAAERRRARSLAAWADREGWRYDRERPELVGRFSGDPFVEVRSNARATHVLCAELRGHRVLAFEYRYSASHHDGRDTRTATHTHTVVAIPVRSGSPVLELREESLGHVVLSPLGVHDLRLGEPAFDSLFYVATSDDRFARAVLDEDVRGWLAEAGAAAVPFRFDGEHLLCWNNRELDADLVRASAETMVALLERVPDAAWESSPQTPDARSAPEVRG